MLKEKIWLKINVSNHGDEPVDLYNIGIPRTKINNLSYIKASIGGRASTNKNPKYLKIDKHDPQPFVISFTLSFNLCFVLIFYNHLLDVRFES